MIKQCLTLDVQYLITENYLQVGNVEYFTVAGCISVEN
jgi:hypothetical protein